MAGRIPVHKVDEIFATADIVEVIGEFIKLKKKGQNFWGLSPWTSEKTPSFSVSAKKGFFKDFSSGRGGNAATFLMEYEGMTYPEALLYLARKYNIDPGIEESQEQFINRDHRESLFILNEFARKYYAEQLTVSDEGKRIAMAYLKERGILDSMIQEFGLGYSPDNWDAFSIAATGKQFQEEFLLESGLSIKSDKTLKLFDRFRGRIMFPIRDHLGKVLGFGGRIMVGDKKEAKYVNSPESPVYHKSKVLFGLDLAKNAIRDEDQALLVEGYMDVISLVQNGVKNVIASSGTALTEDQVRLIKRFTKNVIVLYDGDEAGISAALRGGEILLGQDLFVKVVILPANHDPDSYVREFGKSGFREKLADTSKDFLQFKLDQLKAGKNLSDPSVLTNLVHEGAATIARIPDEVRRGIYVQQVASMIGVAKELVETALRRAQGEKDKEFARDRQRQFRQEEIVSHPATEMQQKADRRYQEKELLRLLLNYADEEIQVQGNSMVVKTAIGNNISGLEFSSPVLETVRAVLIRQISENGMLNPHELFGLQDLLISDFVSGLLAVPEEVSENWMKYEIRSPKADENLSETVVKTMYYYKWMRLEMLRKENQEEIRTCNQADVEMLDALIGDNNEIERQLKEVEEVIGISGAKRADAPANEIS